ncbi:MAG: hypothetical protein KGI60_04445 [Patescibacteria group bacterium]|nr:hypothetical protein [Patescibacteria group bacterium]
MKIFKLERCYNDRAGAPVILAVAFVVAETEEQARSIAAQADHIGHPRYACYWKVVYDHRPLVDSETSGTRCEEIGTNVYTANNKPRLLFIGPPQ